jgi:hypothetical protein
MEAGLYKDSWSEDEKEVFRKWLISHLKYGPVTVYFTKKDGTERKMDCTLKEENIVQYEKKTERVKTLNEETCPVFDLEKNEWRSFRYDAITKVEFTIQ